MAGTERKVIWGGRSSCTPMHPTPSSRWHPVLPPPIGLNPCMHLNLGPGRAARTLLRAARAPALGRRGAAEREAAAPEGLAACPWGPSQLQPGSAPSRAASPPPTSPSSCRDQAALHPSAPWPFPLPRQQQSPLWHRWSGHLLRQPLQQLQVWASELPPASAGSAPDRPRLGLEGRQVTMSVMDLLTAMFCNPCLPPRAAPRCFSSVHHTGSVPGN